MACPGPTTFGFCLSIFLLSSLLLLLPSFSSGQLEVGNNSFSVAVRCSIHSMEMFVQFREPFNGRLKTRPDGQCFVNGRGRLKVGFRLPLDESHRQKCSIVQREEEFIALVDLEMNTQLVTAEDNSYFVRCPILSGEKEGEEKAGTNVSARIGPLDEEMRLLAEDYSKMLLNLTLDTQKGPKARLRNCMAFFPVADTDGKPQTIHLGQQNDCTSGLSPAHQIVQFSPPEFVSQTGGKFFVQCEIATGKDEEPCSNSSSSSTSSSYPALPFFALCPPHLEQYLLAITLGILISLCLVCLCLGVHFMAKYRSEQNRGLATGVRRNGGPKRVQIVCPTAHSSPLSLSGCSAVAAPPQTLHFGCSPIQQPALFSPPPSNFRAFAPSLSSCSGPSSPASTITTALALSLDKLPEPPSLSLAEIRQLNLAFNGLLLAESKGEGEPRVYSFGGIRLNSQFASEWEGGRERPGKL